MSKEKKTSYKKHLIRNPARENIKKGIVIKNTKPVVPPIELDDVELNEASGSSQFPRKMKKTTFNVPDINESQKILNVSPSSKHNSKTDINATESKKTFLSSTSSKLDIPKMHSSLSIGTKIDRMCKMKTSSIKTVSDKRSFDDKILRQVNFPYEQNIYKDLIPLSLPNAYKQTIISSREPMPPRDREPLLENFLEIKPVQEYLYIPNVKLDGTKSKAQSNNLRLYKILQLLQH